MAQQNIKAYKYVDDDLNNRKIRATTKVAGAQTTAAVTATAGMKPTVRTGRGSRGYGIRPRYLRLKRTAGTAPNEKVYYDKLPIFVPGDIAAMSALGSVTLDGVVWTVDSFVSESIR